MQVCGRYFHRAGFKTLQTTATFTQSNLHIHMQIGKQRWVISALLRGTIEGELESNLQLSN